MFDGLIQLLTDFLAPFIAALTDLLAQLVALFGG